MSGKPKSQNLERSQGKDWFDKSIAIATVIGLFVSGAGLWQAHQDSKIAEGQYQVAINQSKLQATGLLVETLPILALEEVSHVPVSSEDYGTLLLCSAANGGEWSGACGQPSNPMAKFPGVHRVVVRVTNVGRAAASQVAIKLLFSSDTYRSPTPRNAVLDLIPANGSVYFEVGNASRTSLFFQGTGEAFDQPQAFYWKAYGATPPPARPLQAHSPHVIHLPPSSLRAS